MPSFKASDELTSKPAWLTAADQLTCFGADAAETALSGVVMHQGWTVPAGGNGNALAQRETIACVNMTSDIDTDTDFSKEVSGAEAFVSFGGTDTFGYLTGNSPNFIVDSNEADHSWNDNGNTIEMNWSRWYMEESTWDAGDGGGPFAALIALYNAASNNQYATKFTIKVLASENPLTTAGSLNLGVDFDVNCILGYLPWSSSTPNKVKFKTSSAQTGAYNGAFPDQQPKVMSWDASAQAIAGSSNQQQKWRFKLYEDHKWGTNAPASHGGGLWGGN